MYYVDYIKDAGTGEDLTRLIYGGNSYTIGVLDTTTDEIKECSYDDLVLFCNEEHIWGLYGVYVVAFNKTIRLLMNLLGKPKLRKLTFKRPLYVKNRFIEQDKLGNVLFKCTHKVNDGYIDKYSIYTGSGSTFYHDLLDNVMKGINIIEDDFVFVDYVSGNGKVYSRMKAKIQDRQKLIQFISKYRMLT